MTLNDVKVGDEVLITRGYGYKTKELRGVTHVTDKRFKVVGLEFVKDTGKQFGASSHILIRASIPTPEERNAVLVKEMIAKIKDMIPFASLTVDQCNRILEIIKEHA